MTYSFTDYVRKNLYGELFCALEIYLEDHKVPDHWRLKQMRHQSRRELVDIEIEKVNAGNLPGTKVACKIRVNADVAVFQDGRGDGEATAITFKYVLYGKGDLAKGLEDFSVLNIEEGMDIGIETPLNDSLMPIISRTEYDKYAENILAEYAPEFLQEPGAMLTQDLAARMGLTVQKAHLSENSNIFGMIVFEDTDVPLWFDNEEVYNIEEFDGEYYDKTSRISKERRIKAGTILVDDEVYYLHGMGTLRMTAAHECVHWALHRKAFLLAKLYNDKYTRIICEVEGKEKREVDDSVKWAEIQATAIAPKLLMPIATFGKKASEIVNAKLRASGTNVLVDVLEDVIRELADFYKVSNTAARIRLVEAGFDEALGVMNYVDGHYVEAYGFTKGTLRPYETFSIGVRDLIFAKFGSSDFKELLATGKFVFVDNHLCYNDERYVRRLYKDIFTLTEEGRLNVDKCCVKFDLKLSRGSQARTGFGSLATLFRDADCQLQFDVGFSCAPQNKAAELRKLIDSRKNMKRRLPDDFPSTLGFFMGSLNITQEQLAEKSWLSTRQIQRYLSGESTPSKDALFQLAHALRLHPFEREMFFANAGIRLTSSDRDLAIDTLLDCSKDLYGLNSMLRELGCETLGKVPQ